MAIGPYSGKETGELALMRQLIDQLDPNDILLADRYFCSYFMIAMLLERNVDFVARLHHARKEDAYRIKGLQNNKLPNSVQSNFISRVVFHSSTHHGTRFV